MRAVSGVWPISSGRIRFSGEDITRLRPDLRVVRGISQAPEGRGVFAGMTVHENLLMGAYTRSDAAGIDEDRERVLTLFPSLGERIDQPGGTLSGGEQQMLAVARALMSRPRLLLLDEPSMGLAPLLIVQIFEILTEIAQQGTTIMVVEQNAHQALSIADRAYVLESGSIVKTGAGGDLLEDPAVKAAYLGVA
jgi:branched-chain amino acid transport system ATP-binding protein